MTVEYCPGCRKAQNMISTITDAEKVTTVSYRCSVCSMFVRSEETVKKHHSMIDEILDYNKAFVENKEYETYRTSKYPDKKIAVISCMDTRLTELLPAALGLKNGDAKIIKIAGGSIAHPFGSVMRSLLIGIYELSIEEILVIGHTDCGSRHTDSRKMVEKMKARGIAQKEIDMLQYCGVDFESWLSGFGDLELSVTASVNLIRKHPLVPEGISVHGFVMDSVTGELTKIT